MFYCVIYVGYINHATLHFTVVLEFEQWIFDLMSENAHVKAHPKNTAEYLGNWRQHEHGMCVYFRDFACTFYCVVHVGFINHTTLHYTHRHVLVACHEWNQQLHHRDTVVHTRQNCQVRDYVYVYFVV